MVLRWPCGFYQTAFNDCSATVGCILVEQGVGLDERSRLDARRVRQSLLNCRANVLCSEVSL